MQYSRFAHAAHTGVFVSCVSDSSSFVPIADEIELATDVSKHSMKAPVVDQRTWRLHNDCSRTVGTTASLIQLLDLAATDLLERVNVCVLKCRCGVCFEQLVEVS